MIKRLISVLLCLILTVNISGCGCVIPYLKSDPNYKTPDQQTKEYSDNLMKILTEKDEVAFKELLSKDILDTHENADDEIENFFEFIEGDILSYDPPRGGAISKTSEYGEYTRKVAKCNLENICTNEDKVYHIYYSYGMIYKDHPEFLGIVCINIHVDGAEYDSVTGYKYGEYYEIKGSDW